MNATTLLTKNKLKAAGLGPQKITFTASDSTQMVHYTLFSYPKLADAGGYELLRSCDNSKELIVIEPPPEGYTIPFLSSIVGQAIVYIHPIQKRLQVNI